MVNGGNVMPENIWKKIGEIKLKIVISYVIVFFLGYIMHEYMHDVITLDAIKDFIDYFVEVYKTLTS